MADPTALFDALAGAGGHPVNRPALNAFVANSQATNGLRSAQTDEALGKAQQMQDEVTASGQLESALGDYFGGTTAAKSKAKAAATIMRGHFGNSSEALDALLKNQQLENRTTLSDPNQLNSPNQTAAQQGVQGKVAEPVAVPDNYVALPGMAPPNVQQTPHGEAVTQNLQAQAGLRDIQTAAGGFKPSAGAGPQDPNAIPFGAYMLYKTGKMPSMGMGNGPARMSIIAGAAQLAQRESNGEDVGNPGFDKAIENGQDFTAAGRALGSFSGGPLGNQTRSLNNVVGHLKLFEDTFKALNNGDAQSLNKLGNMWNKQIGQAAPVSLQAMAHVIGPELTKILTNANAGTGEEREQFAQDAGNLANAPEQMADALGKVRGMLGRQATDLALQYHGATGRGDFAKRYLHPDVASELELGPPPMDSSTTPTVKPPAAPAQPPLTATGPNGQRLMLQNGAWVPYHG